VRFIARSVEVTSREPDFRQAVLVKPVVIRVGVPDVPLDRRARAEK
jgi:hypothetical protein